MGIVHSGTRNPNWRGGRSITEHGYVLIRVGTRHHLADVRGYAYEHRLVAEKLLGRRLKPKEIAYQKNRVRDDNRPNNIAVARSRYHRGVLLRKSGKALRMPDEGNPTIRCACGCTRRFKKYDSSGRPRRFVSGHNLDALR